MTEYNSVADFVDVCESVADSDRDNVVGVTGVPGEGKSTLGLLYYQEWCKRRGMDMNMEKYCIITKNEVNKLFMKEDIQKRMLYWIDEAVNVVYKRTFYESKQIKLMQIFDMMRDSNCTILLMIPDFWDFDSHLVGGRLRFWIHISQRGDAVVMKPSENMFSRDKWNRIKNEKYIEKGQWHKVKNLVGYIKFDAADKDLYARYKLIKHEKRRKAVLEESVYDLSDVKNFLRLARYTRIQFYYLCRRNKLFKHGINNQLMEALNVNMSQELHNYNRVKDDNLIKMIVDFVFSPANTQDDLAAKKLLKQLNLKNKDV